MAGPVRHAPNLVAVAAACVVFSLRAGGQENRVYRSAESIKAGPALYRTPEAAEYFSAKQGGRLLTQSAEEREAAIRSLRAVIALGEMGPAARSAIPVLIDVFPRVQHVTVVRAAHYQSSSGRFDDWVQTYVVTEKNKFLLSSVLMEYATLSACEDFVGAAHETQFLSRTPSSGSIADAVVDIYVVMTLNAGACALTKLTGERFGADQSAWRQWRENQGDISDLQSPVASAGAAPIASGRTVSDIVVGAKYRLRLSTGDEMTGTVEAADDTSIVFETTQGAPYTFKKSLVSEHELLELPKKLTKSGTVSAAPNGAGAEILSFDELARRSPEGMTLDVKLTNGSALRGKVASLQGRMLRLDVDGSPVPIDRDAIDRISTVSTTAPQEQPAPKGPQGPFDTLVVKNPQTDEYGRVLPPLTYCGEITSDNGTSVVLTTIDGRTLTFAYTTVLRRIARSRKDQFSDIERYGKSLSCPPGMVLVDIPPGKSGRPFFKVCIDKYEYPNRENQPPQGGLSFADAKKQCESQGKRICSVEEWQWACGGLEEHTYPYGSTVQEEYCNRAGDKTLEPSGMRRKCISKFGVYDMTGNIFEWVAKKNGDPMLMGGPLAKCQTQSPGLGGEAKPLAGFRCCKSN